jgi:hypothetical protein
MGPPPLLPFEQNNKKERKILQAQSHISGDHHPVADF